MQLSNLRPDYGNRFVKQGVIPLGMNTWKGVNPNPVVTFPYKTWGAIGLISKSGYGKSVLLKRIYSYHLCFNKKRPCVIFDLQGEDHYLSKFPNSKPFPLFTKQGETVSSIGNLRCFAPKFVEDEAHPFDDIFAFNIVDMDTRDYMSLGCSPGTIREFETLINKNRNSIKSFEKFYNDVANLPSKDKDLSHNKGGLYSDHIIHAATKNSMLSLLSNLRINNVFTDKDSKEYVSSFVPYLLRKETVVVNFHQSREFASLYGGMILKDVYKTRRGSARSGNGLEAPLIVVEEADMLLPAHDLYLEIGSNKWLTEILRRGRKYGFMTILATQQAGSINPMIKDHIQNWVIGSIPSKDYSFFETIFSSGVMDALNNLDQNPDQYGAREWIIVYNNKDFDTFRPYNSPLQIHRSE